MRRDVDDAGCPNTGAVMSKQIPEFPAHVKRNMGKEREFIDGLLGTRFNFFVVFFALTLNGALTAYEKESLWLLPSVLFVGMVVSWLLSMSIFRLQQKLDAILQELPDDHPAMIIRKTILAARDDPPLYMRLLLRLPLSNTPKDSRLIGYVIPSFCSVFLTVFFILSLLQMAWKILQLLSSGKL
jgi:hypothetical protein